MEQLGEKIGFLALLLTALSLGTSPHPVALILCYLIHELGHLTLARLMGAEMKGLKLGLCHLSLSYNSACLSYPRELLVQCGGIIFNFISGLLVYLLPFLSGDVYDFFVVGSFSLGVMNLLPVSILDGGGILRSLLSMLMSPVWAERLSFYASFSVSLLMWLVAVYLQIIFASNLSFFFISVLLLVELCFSLDKKN